MDSCILKCQRIRLSDIATVERAQKKLVYPKETIYVQVSACKKTDSNIFYMTQKEGHIETKYAVIVPTEQVVPAYLKIALNNAAGEFMQKYIGDNINIQMELFKYFELDYHRDISTQRYICEKIGEVDNAIMAEQLLCDNWKDFKKVMLDKMMC